MEEIFSLNFVSYLIVYQVSLRDWVKLIQWRCYAGKSTTLWNHFAETISDGGCHYNLNDNHLAEINNF